MDSKCEECVLKFIKKTGEMLKLNNNEKYIDDVKLLSSKIKDYRFSKDFHSVYGEILEKYTGNEDFFSDQKRELNIKVENQFPKIVDTINNSNDPFLEAIRFSIGGNKLDLAQGKELNPDKIDFSDNIMDKYLVETIRKNIKTSNKLLIIGDNCGEIIFDMALVNEIKKINQDVKITYFLRKKPLLNDSTINDLDNFLLSFPVNFKPFELKNDAEVTKLSQYDIIFIKGQANFENYYNIRLDNMFFLLVVKCELIASQLRHNIGDFVIKGNKNEI